MSDMLRGLSMPSRALLTRSRGNSSSARRNSPAKTPTDPTINHAGDVDGSGDDSTTAVVTAGAETVATGAAGAGMVVAGAIELGVDSITSTSRLATRANALETAAGSSADVTGPRAVRLARSVDAVVRLIVSTLMPCDAAIASSNVAELPSSLPSDNTTSTLCSTVGRETGACTDDDVVERSVAVGDDRGDLRFEQRSIGGGGCQHGDLVGERLEADANIRRHRCDELGGGDLCFLDGWAHARRRVDRQDHLEGVGRFLSTRRRC